MGVFSPDAPGPEHRIAGDGGMIALPAPGPVTTAVGLGIAGSAATGSAEFQRGLAGIPVAGGTRKVLVLLAAGTGVEGRGSLLVLGRFCIIGWSV